MTVRLAGMDLIEPLRQGDADGLCGLYAAINSVRLVSAPIQPISQSQSMQLAYDGFEYLKRKHRLENAITHGMGCSLQKKLLKHIVKKATKQTGLSIQYEKVEVTQDNWQKEIAQRLKEGCAVNLVLEGAYDHFTVIAGVTNDKFKLFDSLEFKWVLRENCSLQNQTKQMRHMVNPASLIAIGIAG